MDFIKMHGIGNDFVLIDARDGPPRDWSALAVNMCDRHFGVGSDGLLLVVDSDVANYRMRMYNPDGSEAEMCGNGIRCFARYVYERVERRDEMTVETGAGVKPIAVRSRNGTVTGVSVKMGVPSFNAAEIPVAVDRTPVVDYPLTIGGRELSITCVSMGNPHAIAFVDGDPLDFPLAEIGPKVETHSLFPRKVNFEVCRVASPRHLDVRVWERGAGITLACGSGASATVAAAHAKGLIDDVVELTLPGGTLNMSWDGKGDVVMEGPAEFVFEGKWLKC